MKSSNVKHQKLFEDTLTAFNLITAKKDRTISDHQRRVSKLARALAQELNLFEQQIEAIKFAALIHDLGKLFIPLEMFYKQRPISATKFKVFEKHPQSAYDILKGIEFPWPVAEIILQHHEKLDGTGYPLGLNGDIIVPEAKIIAVADVVDFMTNDKGYRTPPGKEKALEKIVEKKGSYYDPKIVDACIILFIKKHFQW
jgi:putative nucleotidyltransferase with HDIG domain